MPSQAFASNNSGYLLRVGCPCRGAPTAGSVPPRGRSTAHDYRGTTEGPRNTHSSHFSHDEIPFLWGFVVPLTLWIYEPSNAHPHPKGLHVEALRCFWALLACE